MNNEQPGQPGHLYPDPWDINESDEFNSNVIAGMADGLNMYEARVQAMRVYSYDK